MIKEEEDETEFIDKEELDDKGFTMMMPNGTTMKIFDRVKIEKGEASGLNDKGKAVIVYGAFYEKIKDGKYVYIGIIGDRGKRAWGDKSGNVYGDVKGKIKKLLVNWDEDVTLFRRERLGTLGFCVETTPRMDEIG